MCYDLAFETTIESILDYFPDLANIGQVSMNFGFNAHYLAQGNPLYPVITMQNQVPTLNMFEWRIIRTVQGKPINLWNIQSEKIFNKWSVWYELRNNRCLVPTSGIYEHREVKGFKNKIPYFVKLANRGTFFIPGLYTYSNTPDPETGEVKGMFAFLTRGANEVMRKIHNGNADKFRMPFFMQPEQAIKWIDPDLTEQQMKEMLAFELPAEELEYWPVFTIRGTKPRPDGLAKNAPYDWSNLPPLGIDEIIPETLL